MKTYIGSIQTILIIALVVIILLMRNCSKETTTTSEPLTITKVEVTYDTIV